METTGVIEPVSFCEIDPYCRKVLNRHWPDVPIIEDIRGASGKETRADIFTGGVPCQPFSVAGKRKGTADDRHLWPEYRRIVQESNPAWVVFENVVGLAGMELIDRDVRVEGKTIIQNPDHDFYSATIIRQANMLLDEICREFEEDGYDVLPIVIPACAVNAPHRRDRVWLLCHAKHAGSLAAKISREPGTGEYADKTGTIKTGKSPGSDWQRWTMADTIPPGLEGYARDGNKGNEPGRIGEDEIGSVGAGRVSITDADTDRAGQYPDQGQGQGDREEGNNAGRDGAAFTDTEINTERTGQQPGEPPGLWRQRSFNRDWWSFEPRVGRVADGIPDRVDRIKGLGNAIVPAIARILGEFIIKWEIDNAP